MAEEKKMMTRAGLDAATEELKYRKEVRRAEIAAKLKEARAQGDLSENAEYDAAKDERDENESEIARLEDLLKVAVLIEEDDSNSKEVSIGSKVTLRMDIKETDDVFILVGSGETNSLEGKISVESPIGKALMGAKARSTVSYTTPSGKVIKCKIKKVERT